MILGLDISTTCIGICLLNDDGDLKFLDHLDIKKIDTYDSAHLLLEYIKNIPYKITHVFIEEPKKSFQNQHTSNNTILMLTAFNAICSYVVYDCLGILPVHINESTARKKCGLKILSKKKSGIPQKEQAFLQMKEKPTFIDYKWVFKRTGTIKDYHMDEMDAYIVARAGFLSLKKIKKNSVSV